MKIAIIGGGPSALGAAYELSETSHSVSVFERSSRLGGLAESSNVNSVPLENFYHHLFPTYKDLIVVAKEMGIGNTIFFTKGRTANYIEGRLHPFSNPLDLLRFKPLSLTERLQTAYWTLYLKIKTSWDDLEKVRATDWLPAHFGQKAYEIIWKPLLISKFAQEAQSISMAWMWGKIHERPSRFGYFTGGFETWFNSIRRRLENRGVKFHLNTEITTMILQNNQLIISSPLREEVFDAVIVAAPPSILERLAGKFLSTRYLEYLRGLKYVGVICNVLVLKKRLSKYYWTNIQESESPFVAIIEQTNFVPENTYNGYHPVYLSRYLNTHDPFYQMGSAEIEKKFLHYLKQLHPQFNEDWVVESKIYRAPFAQHVVPVGYKKPSYNTPIPNLWWVSMSHIYPLDRGTNHSFVEGRRLVKTMLNATTS